MPMYVLTTGEGDAKRERLIDAPNQASARNYAARKDYQVALATTADTFRLAKAGVDLETVGVADTVEPSAAAQEDSNQRTAELQGGSMAEPNVDEEPAKAGKAK